MLTFGQRALSGLLVLGASVARAVRYGSNHETPLERVAHNALLNDAMTQFREVNQNPEQSSGPMLRLALDTAGLVGFAYYNYAQQNQNRAPGRTLPAYRPAQPANRPANPAALALPAPSQTGALNFSQRLNQIGFDDDNIPEDFIDPISFEVMDNPILAYTETRLADGTVKRSPHHYDRATFERLNGVCPENRLYFLEANPDNALRDRIEAFVLQQESRVNALNVVSVSRP